MRAESEAIHQALDAVAAKTPAPGGGFVASAVGGLAAALGQMVLAYSLGKKRLAAHEAVNQAAAERLAAARALLLALAGEDAQAYELVNELSRLPSDDPRRKAQLPAAAMAATQAPVATAAACADLLRLFETMTATTNEHLRSDLAIAAILADAGARACRWNVLVNLPGLVDAGVAPDRVDRILPDLDAMLAQASARAARIEATCATRPGPAA